VLPTGFSEETNGDQQPLIEALLQALSAFVDRLDQAKGRVESDKEHED
jgi:hypothetical protein